MNRESNSGSKNFEIYKCVASLRLAASPKIFEIKLGSHFQSQSTGVVAVCKEINTHRGRN